MTNLAPESIGLALCQLTPTFGDVTVNASRIAALAAATDAQLLLTPELSLTGYDLRDRAADLAQSAADAAAAFSQVRAVAFGYAERGADGVIYNAAAVVAASTLLFHHRKVYLPTYGMFDEGRYFGRGQTTATFVLGGFRFGILICEDFWHPALAYLLACQGLDCLLVMAAAPGRGVWEGGEFGPFASADVWDRIARVTAQVHGIYVVLCNRTGVEGGVTFAGGSLVAAPDGSVLARAGAAEETLDVRLTRAAIQRARTPYAHIRDEQPRLVLDELHRILRV